MKKSMLAVVGLASVAATGVGAAAAQAAAPTWKIVTSRDGSVQTATLSSAVCVNGQPVAVVAVRNTSTTRKLYVTVHQDSVYAQNGNAPTDVPMTVSTRGAFAPLQPAPSTVSEVEVSANTTSNPYSYSVYGSSSYSHGEPKNTPANCNGLPSGMPSLPAAWAAAPSKPVITPTKPAPVKTTKPVVTPTKPAPSTSKASATVTVKVTTPGGSKTTSTSGVVPVTKPVPSGGVTATATVKIPSKGVTATATETVKPISPSAVATSSSSAVGPKVQTDGTSNNNALETELAGAGALAAIAGAGVFVARRRSN